MEGHRGFIPAVWARDRSYTGGRSVPVLASPHTSEPANSALNAATPHQNPEGVSPRSAWKNAIIAKPPEAMTKAHDHHQWSSRWLATMTRSRPKENVPTPIIRAPA